MFLEVSAVWLKFIGLWCHLAKLLDKTFSQLTEWWINSWLL